MMLFKFARDLYNLPRRTAGKYIHDEQASLRDFKYVINSDVKIISSFIILSMIISLTLCHLIWYIWYIWVLFEICVHYFLISFSSMEISTIMIMNEWRRRIGKYLIWIWQISRLQSHEINILEILKNISSNSR